MSLRDVARIIGKTEAYRQSRHERKKAAMLFAHLKLAIKASALRLVLVTLGILAAQGGNSGILYLCNLAARLL